MNLEIIIREYRAEDASALADIFYNTVHNINIRDYSKEQVDAWAPTTSLELERWQKKWEKFPPFVAIAWEEITGFAEFEPNGHIDCFYCHHKWIGKGVGYALMQAIHQSAKQQNIARIFAEVSTTAKPFFIRNGFCVVKEQTIACRGVTLTNFVMEKIFKN